MQKVKYFSAEGISSLEYKINRFIELESNDEKNQFKILSVDIDRDKNDAILIYESKKKPIRKYEIKRFQNQIERTVDEIQKFMEILSTLNEPKIEQFSIYDDYKDRERDHIILIYSYNEYPYNEL